MPRDRKYDLIAFDVDGTLVGSDDGRVVWQYLNERFDGTRQENTRRFEAYLAGEITYARWVDLDVGGWVRASATRDQIARVILEHLFLNPGARESAEELRRRGYRLSVISGTLDLTIELLFPGHPFEEVLSNKIWFDEDGKIGGWEATPYDMAGKAEALITTAGRLDIPIARTVFVGDNINDIHVMNAAGLAVAFEPKDESVDRAADVVIRDDLRGLLKIL